MVHLQTIGGMRGLQKGITYVDGFLAKGNQSSKLVAAAESFIHLFDLPK